MTRLSSSLGGQEAAFITLFAQDWVLGLGAGLVKTNNDVPNSPHSQASACSLRLLTFPGAKWNPEASVDWTYIEASITCGCLQWTLAVSLHLRQADHSYTHSALVLVGCRLCVLSSLWHLVLAPGMGI